MEKNAPPLQPGSCPSAVSPFTSIATSDGTWVSIVGVLPQISNSILGEGRTDRRASPTARSRVGPIVFLHYLSSVPQRTPLYGMRRGIPRSQSSPHVSSRNIRELLFS
ncbi:hypothetical protein TcYC6_0064880 [Trypanosoma cruzi]|nr:hypothetical protein TcYC6_0064880 [Trypanosoma cruzi]